MDHLRDANGAPIYRPRVQLFCKFNDISSPKDASERTFNDFYHLPKQFGWEIDDNCLTKQTRGSPNLNFVVQRWLFFEVLYQVFGHLPTFDWNDFRRIDPSNRSYVNTSKLPKYLLDWSDNEKSCAPVALVERNRRLIRIQQVLDRARYFVSQCCAVDNPEGNTKWGVDDMLALSLMVLGETLTRAQTLIHRVVGFQIQGWCNYELHNYGWGYSKLMFHHLTQEGWCMRAVYRLKALLRGNTIGLLYLYSILRESGPRGPDHALCNKDKCLQEVSRIRNQYHHCSLGLRDHCSEDVEHYGTTNQPSPCKSDQFKGEVDGAALAAVIDEGSIPLFQWHKEEKKLELIPMSSFSSKSYAVFSHVWADGFGCFDGKNDIPLCVLNMFSNLLEKIAMLHDNGQEVPNLFWIDTLCIPESKKFLGARLKAIRQMHNIYTYARYTVVLDQSLMRVDIGSGYSEPAMKITMSNWMTRMWTLQEAVLSKNIYFNFKDRVCPMERLEELYEPEDRSLHDCLPVVSHLYWEGILGTERQAIRQQVAKRDGWQPEAGSLACIWKALQWRSTAHPIHEFLSLATMLNIDTEAFARPTDHEENTMGYSEECDSRMIKLLHRFSKLKHCPVPPGMIFLPGPRLTTKGFGWAPKTWLSSHEIESPDPLSLGNRESTRLTSDGLEVQFPGFLLHDLGDDRGTWSSREHFCFPIDSSLLQWYRVEPKEEPKEPGEEPKEEMKEVPRFPIGEKLIGQDLAIILPRFPLGDLNEIALLVRIEYSRNGIRYAEILNRVLISRIGKQDEWSRKFRTGAEDAMCAGQVLMPDTYWCVDGPFHQEDGIEANDFHLAVNGNMGKTLGSSRDPQPGNFMKSFTSFSFTQRTRHPSGRSTLQRFVPTAFNRQKRSENSMATDTL